MAAILETEQLTTFEPKPGGTLYIGFRPDGAPGTVLYCCDGTEIVFREPRSVRYRIKPRGVPFAPLWDVQTWYVATIGYGDGEEMTLYPAEIAYEIH